jgi:ketosteroid isomerase-like protein
MTRTSLVSLFASVLLAVACTTERRAPSATAENAGIDSMNVRLVSAYHARDPRAYAALFTDTAVFEWPAVATVRGRAGLETMARDGWPALPEMELKLNVAARRLASDHATEFGAFEQSWRDSTGGRTTEYGRYVALLARQRDGSWLMDRFFGFEDSTRAGTAKR